MSDKLTLAALVVAFFVASSGCASCAAAEARRGGSTAGEQWQMELPVGWKTWHAWRGDAATASRLGRRLQRIEVRVLPLDLATSGVAADVARAAFALVARDSIAGEAVLLSAQEVAFAGMPGLRAELTFQDPGGLRQRAVLLAGKGERAWYCLMYAAAESHYYARGLAEFAVIAASFRPLDVGDVSGAATRPQGHPR